ncbi:MAG: hypothetical protein ABIZ72_05410, partial [Candidatus Limnocylindrales bacterium]
MTDGFTSELRQHLLDTADERPADGQLAAIVEHVAITAQRHPLAARLTRFPDRIGPFPSATVRFGLVGLALVVAIVAVASFAGGTPPTRTAVDPAAELGIFAPVAGKIVSGVWAIDPIAVDPSAPSLLTSVGMGPKRVLPLGWSSDGTELLFMREDPTDQSFPYDRQLFILHADGTETQVTPEPVGGAAISPDGSRVVFAARGARDG